MAVKFVILSFLFSLSTLSLSKPLRYETLIPKSLPTLQSLTWEEDSEIRTHPTDEKEELIGDVENTISLQLHHVDYLHLDYSNSTADALFHRRLSRDAGRVEALSTIVAMKTAVKKNSTVTRRVGKPGAGFSSSIISGLTQGSGEYFTRLGVGTPAKYSYMVLDTGSDVVWIQCSPCRKCYTQSDPVFDPKKSSTFAGITCGSPLCKRLDTPGCNLSKKCMYQVSYGDGSFTVGEFSTETMTFRRSRVKNIALGCGHDNEGLFVGAAGLLGLGRGRLSFPSQAGPRFGNKFSYCLVDRSASAKPSSIIFGSSAVSRKALFTPLLRNPKLDTFYYIGLAGISVGGNLVPGITAAQFHMDSAGNGGLIIDSGTSVTRLARPAYEALRDAFRAGAKNLKRAPGFSLFDTCYNLAGKLEVKVPTVMFHFRGANLGLPASNYLIPVDNKGTFCFAFAGTSSGLSIIGNIQQQGFRVVYDLAGSRVGFSRDSCA